MNRLFQNRIYKNETYGLQKAAMLLCMSIIILHSVVAQKGKRGAAPMATDAVANGTFRDIPVLEDAFFDASPVDLQDGIPVGKLGRDGGDKAKILAMAREMANHQHGNYDCMLIAHKGKLLFEYYGLRGRINLPHPQASATKAYTSLLVGRAIQLGYLTMADLDKPLVSFLKDLDPSKWVDGAEKITLHMALTMRGGLGITQEQRDEFEQDSASLKGQGLVQTLLEYSAPITTASQQYLYGNFNPRLVMQVIEAVVPGTAQDFIKHEFLGKLGITQYTWQDEISGLPEAGWRVSFTSRDMLKLGTLAMNKGQWNGEQLIPEAYIDQAIHRIVRESDDENFADRGSVSNTGYGYFWWQSDLKVGNRNYFSTSARGGGGQYVLLIEELDLIVVVTAYGRDDVTLQLTADQILPAFIQ